MSVETYQRSVSFTCRRRRGSGRPTTRCRTDTSSACPRHRNVAREPSMIGAPCRSMNRSIAAPSRGLRSSSRLMASLDAAAAHEVRRAAGLRQHASILGHGPVGPDLDLGAVVEQQAASRARTAARAPSRGSSRRAAGGGARGASRPRSGPVRSRGPRPPRPGRLAGHGRCRARPARSAPSPRPTRPRRAARAAGTTANRRRQRSRMPTCPPAIATTAASRSSSATS